MWTLIGSLLSGGATGLLGSLLSGLLAFFNQQQKNAHELRLLDAEKDILKLEIEGRTRVAEIENENDVPLQQFRMLSTSIESDQATYSDGHSRWLVLVDVVRGLTRPVLTAFLGIFIMVLWFTTVDTVLKAKIAASVLYIATTCFFWWFGTRIKKPL